MTMICVLAVSLGVAASLGAATPAGATTQTAHSGDVAATFEFRGHLPDYSGERLTITRGSSVFYQRAVDSRFCHAECAPGSLLSRRSSVHVLDLEHNGRRDVVLDLYSGGAHCCSIEQIFSADPTGKTYVETGRNFGDPGARIVDLRHNGRFQFLTADDAFAYAFTDYAASGLPIQILTFANRHFKNVTRKYPRLIAKDAATWLRFYQSTARRHYEDSIGLIAAWAADEEMLGHDTLTRSYLAAEAAAGHLNSAFSLAAAAGRNLVTDVERFLQAHGYSH